MGEPYDQDRYGDPTYTTISYSDYSASAVYHYLGHLTIPDALEQVA